MRYGLAYKDVADWQVEWKHTNADLTALLRLLRERRTCYPVGRRSAFMAHTGIGIDGGGRYGYSCLVLS